MKWPSLKVLTPVSVSLVSVLMLALGATAGSLAPSGPVAATMHSLADIYDSIASDAFDSSAVVGDRNGSLLANLKYIEANMAGASSIVWASGSNNIWSLNSGNVGIGTSSPTTKLEVVGLASASYVNVSSASYGYQIQGATVLAVNGFFANTWVGSDSGRSNTTGFANSGDGWRALYSNTTGSNNTAFGSTALYSNRTGQDNTAVGTRALFSNTTSSYNTGLGSYVLESNTGSFNTAVGQQALRYNSGAQNTAVGSLAMSGTTLSGSSNAAFGGTALAFNSTGSNNSALGTSALYNNTTGDNNSALGYQSLYSTTDGYENVAIGRGSLYSNTSGYDNVAIGVYSLYDHTAGQYNVAVGDRSLMHTTTGQFNTGMGSAVAAANTTGSNNTAFGYAALAFNSTGNFNTAIGQAAGYSALGSGNVFLGRSAGYQERGSNTLWVDNQSTASSSALIYGEFDNRILSFAANVGVGTSTPETKLEVVGVASVSSLIINSSAFNPASYLALSGGTLSGNLIGTNASLSLNFEVAGYASLSNALWVSPPGYSGNVGVGTSTPETKLEVVGIASISSGLYGVGLTNCNDAVGSKLLWSSATGTFSCGSDAQGLTAAGGWTDDGTTVRLSTAADNVGIGTISPLSKLHVAGDTIITGVLQTNGTSVTNYNRIGTGVTSRGIGTADDVFISGSVEVDGTLYSNSAFVSNLATLVGIEGAGLVGDCNSVTAKLIYNYSTRTFGCGADAGTSVDIYRDQVLVQSAYTKLNINGAHFTVVASGSTEADLGLNWGAGGPASLSMNETVSGFWTFTSGASIAGNLETSGFASASQYFGGNLTTCNGTTDKIGYDAVTGLFSCGIDTGSAGNKIVTSNSLDFDELVNAMTLDADTSIMNNGFALTMENASVSGNFEVAGSLQAGTTSLASVLVSGGASLSANVDISGKLDVTGQLFATSASASGNIEIVGYASASQYFGANLVTCNGANDKLAYDASTGRFSCGTDNQTAGRPASNSLDFDEFVNAMNLDANTSIASNGFTFTLQTASISGDLTTRRFFGAGLPDCNDVGQKLLWAASGSNAGKFTCGSDQQGVSSAGGWTDDGTTVRLSTAADNVGIGTTTPNSKLHIVGNVGANDLLYVASSSANVVGLSVTRKGVVAIGMNNNPTQAVFDSFNQINEDPTNFNPANTTVIKDSNDLFIHGGLEVTDKAFFINTASVGGNFEVAGPVIKVAQNNSGSSPLVPNFTWSADPGTGLATDFQGGTGRMYIMTANTVRILLDPQGDMQLGGSIINSTNPTARLTVFGTGSFPIANIASSSGEPSIYINKKGAVEIGAQSAQVSDTQTFNSIDLQPFQGRKDRAEISGLDDLFIGGDFEVEGIVDFGANASIGGYLEVATSVGGVRIPMGNNTLTIPGYTWSDDPNTGFEDDIQGGNGDHIYTITGGVTRAMIDAQGDTQLGGAIDFNTNPAARLTVFGATGQNNIVSFASSSGGVAFSIGANGAFIVGGGTYAAGDDFNQINTNTSGVNPNRSEISSVTDLFIAGDLEVDGIFDVGGAASVGGAFETVNYIRSGGVVYAVAAGSAAAPQYSFTTDTGTGMYRVAANTLGFTTGSTERMRITSTGNVGIGTTTPAAKLDVVSDVIFRDVLQAAGTATVSYSRFGTGLATNTTQLNAGNDLFISDAFEVGGKAFFDSTASVAGQLELSAGSAALPSLKFNNNEGLFDAGTNILGFTTAGVERMRIDAVGNVGIGTTTTTNAAFTFLSPNAGSAPIAWIGSVSGGPSIYITKSGAVEIGATYQQGAGRRYNSVDSDATNVGALRTNDINNTDDLYIADSLEVHGILQVDGNVSVSSDFEMTANGHQFILPFVNQSANMDVPVLTFEGDRDTGISHDSGNAPNKLFFDTGGIARGLIDGHGNFVLKDNVTYGSFGNAKLDVYGSASFPIALFSSSSSQVQLMINKKGALLIGTHGNGGTTQTYNSVDVDPQNSPNATRTEINDQNDLFIADALQVAGIVDFGSSASIAGQLELTAGTAALPSLKFSNNGGLFGAGTNILGFTTAGVERMRIDATGNVGIGTTTPTATLHVVGDTSTLFTVASSTNSRFTVLENGNVGVGNAAPAGLFQVGSGATAPLTVLSGGNIGLGTSSPRSNLSILFSADDHRLDISQNYSDSATAPTTIGSSSYLQLGGQESGANSYRLITFGYHAVADTYPPAYMGYQEIVGTGRTTGDLIFGTRGVNTDIQPSERMRILSTGNVGIGIAAPATRLEVFGTASASYLFSTNGLQVAGGASVSYNRFGTGTTGHSLTGSSDVLISDDLEVNGVLYADGGIDGATQSITNITNITGSGTGRFGKFIADDGTAAAPSFTFANDLTSGMYRPSGSQLGFSVGGSVIFSLQTTGATLHVGDLNIAGVYKIGSTPGISVGPCGGNQYVGNGVQVIGGIIVAGSCRTDDNYVPPDVAENFFKAEPEVGAGMIVAPYASGGLDFGVTGSMSKYQQGVVRTTRAYQNALGVISTDAQLILAANIASGSTGSAVPVTLAGRVPVRVTTGNGAIKVGDRIVASDVPGVGMKATQAGMTVGMALEPTNFVASGSEQTIIVFIQPTYWAPDVGDVASMTLDDSWLTDMFNRVVEKFASLLGITFGQGSVTADKVESKQLCVGARCITEEEFIKVFGTATPEPTPAAEPASSLAPAASDSPEMVQPTPDGVASGSAPYVPTPESAPSDVIPALTASVSVQ